MRTARTGEVANDGGHQMGGQSTGSAGALQRLRRQVWRIASSLEVEPERRHGGAAQPRRASAADHRQGPPAASRAGTQLLRGPGPPARTGRRDPRAARVVRGPVPVCRRLLSATSAPERHERLGLHPVPRPITSLTASEVLTDTSQTVVSSPRRRVAQDGARSGPRACQRPSGRAGPLAARRRAS